MSDKIKDTEKMETKNLESIPCENDLPDVKSKEYYEKLVTQRRVNSLEVGEVSTEDLEGVAGGYDPETPHKYGGPNMYQYPLSLKKKIMLKIAFPFILLKDKINDRKRKKEKKEWRKGMDEWEKYIEKDKQDSSD